MGVCRQGGSGQCSRSATRARGKRRPMTERALRADPRDRLGYAARHAPPRRPPTGPPGRAPRRPRRSFLGRLARLGLLLFLWCAILGGAVLAYFAFTLPDTSQLGIGERRSSITILAQDGSTLATFGDIFGEPVTLKEMSAHLLQAVIATEDRRFYSHFGIDPIGLARAIFTDLRAGHLVQGGRTIT